LVYSTDVSIDSTGRPLFLAVFEPDGFVGAAEGEFEGSKILNVGVVWYCGWCVWKIGRDMEDWLENFEDLTQACLFCIMDVEHKGFGDDSGCK
jgi:hypothetical protein